MEGLIMDDKMSAYDKVMAKAAEKKAEARARKEQRDEDGVVNKLVIDRTPNGLYSVRYSYSGPVPDELKGYFTHKARIVDIATRLGKPLEV
jgi:hypothetical protein